MSNKLSIFIPAYNAEKTVRSVIARIPAVLWNDIQAVYLIDDGSGDDTSDVLQSIAEEHPGCIPVFHKVNKGYGKTARHGLELCSGDGCAFAVCLHADGQYPPEMIAEGIGKMEGEHADILQGSRIASGTALSGGMPRYKYISGKILTLLENMVFGMRMTDYHSGFLIYRTEALQKIRFSSLSGSFDFDLEMIASARAARMKIIEMPIPTRYADEVSYLNPVHYGLRVLSVLVKYAAGRYSS